MNIGEKVLLPDEISTFRDVRYADVAKAFDAYGERVEDPDEIAPALQRAVDSGLPAVLDVQVSGGVEAPGMGLKSIF